jgi:thiosulfate/3-mercaptopyruvate sulfurtransferase
VLFSREPGDLSSVTRAWFTLVWAGVPGVHVMLGGLNAWLAAGRPLAIRRPLAAPASTTSGAVEPEGNVGRGDPSAAEASGRPAVVRAIGADELHAVAKIGTVLDARPAEHFAGFVDDPRSGHVPGATSAPAQQLLGLDGALLPAADLRRWLLRRGAIGGHRVAAYCHGGVASSTLVFAGALLGQPIDLYVDSWSAWSRDPARPVVRGSARGRSGDIDFSCFADSSAI